MRQCGGLVLRTPLSEKFLNTCTGHFDAIGIPYEELDAATIKQRYKLDLTIYGVPKRIDDPTFAEPAEGQGEITHGIYAPKRRAREELGLRTTSTLPCVWHERCIVLPCFQQAHVLDRLVHCSVRDVLALLRELSRDSWMRSRAPRFARAIRRAHASGNRFAV